MRLSILIVQTDRKDLRPEQLFKLKVLIRHVEDGLVLLASHLVEDGIGDHLLKDALVTAIILWLKEELVAIRARHNVVDKHTDLVAQALVVLLVASAQDHLEGGLKGRHNFGVDSQLLDGLLATDLDEVPECLNGERDNVGAEVLRLADDANEVASNTLQNDVIGDWLEKADGSDGLQHRDHRVNARALHSVLRKESNKCCRHRTVSKCLQVAVTFFEETLKWRCILSAVNLLFLFSRLTILDILNTLAGNVGKRVRNLLASILPVGEELTIRIALNRHIVED